MVLLSRLFGSRKDTAKELVMDDEKRMALWQQHLANYPLREKLSKHFSPGNIDRAMQDFNATLSILEQIESLISPELISISGEEKLDKEILADLKILKSTAEIEKLARIVVFEKKKQAALISLFREIHDLLKIELHLINLIKKRPPNARELLLQLFSLIFHNEAGLYKVFMEEFFSDKSIHTAISRLARAVILKEELEEEIETDEEIFAKEMVKKMHDDSKHHYRQLAEDIYFDLLEIVGAPLESSEDFLEAVERLKALMQDDSLLHRIIKKKRPRYDDIKITAVILAFRKAFDLGHFDELDAGFFT